MKILGLAIVIALCFVSASAQTANELTAKYGAAHSSYEIRPGIFITVTFAAGGRAREILLEKRHVRTSGTIVIDVDPNFLSPAETKPIVEEIVPLNQRGKQTSSGAFVGGMTVTFEEYENVSITYYRKCLAGGEVNAAIVVRWKNR